MITALLLAALQAAPAQIVVTGKRLDDAYRECVAGGCPPLRDAQVSIAWAEKLFRDGAYRPAKNALAKAVSRNRSFANSAPRPVAALYEAYATIALQNGDQDLYRRAVTNQVQTLRDNLPATDPAVTDSSLALGDMWMKLRKPDEADAAYLAAERDAKARGQTTLALSAALRRVFLASAREEPERAKYLLDTIAHDPGFQDPAVASLLPVLYLRVAAKNADDADIARLEANVARSSVRAQPVLLFSPPLDATPSADAEADARRLQTILPPQATSSEVGTIMWADVGFRIRPDGHTDDVEVLRGSIDRAWVRPVVKQINGRRYAGFVDAAGQGVYRIERYTLRGKYTTPAGSFIRRRAGAETIEIVDLTTASTRLPQVD